MVEIFYDSLHVLVRPLLSLFFNDPYYVLSGE
jgi:hypothetical protein